MLIEPLAELLSAFPPLAAADLSRPFELDSVDLLQLVMHLEAALGVDFAELNADPDDLRSLEGIRVLLARRTG